MKTREDWRELGVENSEDLEILMDATTEGNTSTYKSIMEVRDIQLGEKIGAGSYDIFIFKYFNFMFGLF